MALKQLVITKRMADLKKQLEALRARDTDFETRAAALKKRETELEQSVNEVTDETSEEDKKVVDDAVTEFEKDQDALDKEKSENDTEKSKLEEEIRQLQGELDELNKKAEPPAADPPENDERKVENHMIRSKFFKSPEQRSAFVAREDVKGFLGRVREMKGQTRAVTGAELSIPTVMLELLRDNLYRYSKLVALVRLRTVSGKARQTIAGTIPEGIWMEAVGKLNELALSFNQIEVDGYKVGGFIPIPNSTLEDSDINLFEEIMDALGQAIGFAVDKAILYGTGVKMPLGIATRLAQTVKPSDWDENAPAWVDLHATNLLKFDPASMTPEAFFAALLQNLGTAAPNYASGGTFWALNRKTKMKLLAKAVTFNAAGAIVAGMNNTMPIEGGTIVELPFIPDDDIIGGYGSLYLLAERAGAQLAVSEHVKFIEDQTVFRGTARYDGAPVIGGGFVIVNIANVAPTTSLSFAADTANP